MVRDAIDEFLNSGAGQAALAVLAIGVVDFLLLCFTTIRDRKSFEGLSDWLRTDLAGKILPIWLLLFVGHFAQGIRFANIPLILAAGLGAAAVYVTEVLASILKVWGLNRKNGNGKDKR